MMTRFAIFLAYPLLLAGCVDPGAVQKFAQLAPPAAQFHTLVLDYPALQTEFVAFNNVATNVGSNVQVPAFAQAFCAHIAALDQMHAGMVNYMNALGAAATSGAAVKSTAGTAGGSGTPAAASPQAPCPPATLPMPAVATASPPAAAAAPASQSAAATLGSDLQAFAKAVPDLHITANDASAASAVITLFQDAATTYLREQAVRDALREGHDSFMAAVAIETKVIGYVASDAQLYASSLTSDVRGISRVVPTSNPTVGLLSASVTARLALALTTGQIASPNDALAVQAAAQSYVTALNKLQQAYVALYQTSSSGGSILTSATWTTLQPLFTDVQNAYTALEKL
jgi:hypothetical protein